MFDWLKRKADRDPTPPEAPAVSSTADAAASTGSERFAAPANAAVQDPIVLIEQADAARQRGDTAAAIELYLAAHRAAPERVYPLYWLATLFAEGGNPKSARTYALLGLERDPEQIGLLMRMGTIAHDLRDPVAALHYFQQVARIDANAENIDALLADQLCFLGRVDEGIAAFDRALAHQPDSLALQQSRLFCLNFAPLIPPHELAHEHFFWGARHEADLSPLGEGEALNLDKPVLRVGYVSPDLRDHAVAYFVAPLFEFHDRTRFEIHAFDTSPNPEDAVTARMRAHAHQWHRVAGTTDEELAARIRALGIDILVDLSGHTKGNRLLTFARKPAPVQVTWLGYLSTTGLTRMDYRFTDARMDPPGLTELLHTEALVRLPVQACFSPHAESPAVGPSPRLCGGPLTLGSVNQWPKVSRATKALWGSILAADRGIRLRVVARGGQNPEFRRLVAAEFEQHGALAEQVEVFPPSDIIEFLTFLQDLDIALDPFPYGGGTTTMQCLWMGVPVVTLAGATALARNSVGPLTAVGLADLVCSTPDAYRDTVLALGHDESRLARLRNELRARMAGSLLTDGPAFARSVESAYRAMWTCRPGEVG